MVEEGATTGGAFYEFCTLSPDRRRESAAPQKILREWRASIKTPTGCAKRFTASAPKAVPSDTATRAQKILEKSVKAAGTQRQRSVTTASAAIRKQGSLMLHKQVGERSEEMQEARRADVDIPTSPIVLEIVVAMRAKLHFAFPACWPPLETKHNEAPTRNPLSDADDGAPAYPIRS